MTAKSVAVAAPSDAHRLFSDRARALLDERCIVPALPAALGKVCVSGIGGSEGPARVHAAALRAAGINASFVPVSGVPSEVADELRLFSQNLSPNACLALTAATRFSRRVLVTAQAPADPKVRRFVDGGGTCVFHPPATELGLLVRIVGPTIATHVALGTSPAVLGDRARTAFERGRAIAATIDAGALSGSVAFVTSGDGGERAFGLRWKWLETLGVCDPPIYDVLSFIHGPFQLWHDRPMIFFSLRSAGDDAALWAAFAKVVRPAQRVVAFEATASGPMAWFEHDAIENALLCRALELGVGHGTSWRGVGEDRAMYEIGG
ncbi:MAG: hypothetical protein IT381_27005 [Deltaproteobacteria bacterium]|nr:hypothetical protein [Deltaproteobacteria bacterium]